MRTARAWRPALLAGAVLATAVTAPAAGADAGDQTVAASPEERVAAAVRQVDRATEWQLARRIGLDFDTFHPQGFARVGDRLFLSSVEVIEPPERYPEPIDGHDRSPGRGVGHVFVLDLDGNLLEDVVVGEGDMYHPGGIDSDGRQLWVPVAEYRPYSASVVYTIDLRTLEVRKRFRVDDHVGGVVADRATGLVHGVTWGSREFYTWTRRGQEVDHSQNPSHFVDYQDCAYAGRATALCTGITELAGPGGEPFELGGIALLDLRTRSVLHEVPVQLWSAAGHVATRNPVHLEVAGADGDTLRMWAAPDDGEEGAGTEILVYEATVGAE